MKKHAFKRKLAKIEENFKDECITWRQMVKQLGIRPFKDLEPTEAKLASGNIVNSGKEFQETYKTFWENLCKKDPNPNTKEQKGNNIIRHM